MWTWLQPLRGELFLIGLVFGLLAVVAARFTRRWALLDLAGPTAVLVAIATSPMALIGAALVGIAQRLGRPTSLARLALALAAATVAALALDATGLELLPLAVGVVVVVLAAPAAPAGNGGWIEWAGAVLVAGGIYANVPDTERALVLLGYTVGAAAMTLVVRRSEGPGAGYPLVAAVVVVLGGSPRPSALIGGTATLSLLALRSAPVPRCLVAIAVGAYITSRIGGLAARPAVAWASSLAGVAAALALAEPWERWWSERAVHRPRRQ